MSDIKPRTRGKHMSKQWLICVEDDMETEANMLLDMYPRSQMKTKTHLIRKAIAIGFRAIRDEKERMVWDEEANEGVPADAGWKPEQLAATVRAAKFSVPETDQSEVFSKSILKELSEKLKEHQLQYKAETDKSNE